LYPLHVTGEPVRRQVRYAKHLHLQPCSGGLPDPPSEFANIFGQLTIQQLADVGQEIGRDIMKDRRNVLGLSAITALGLAVLSDNAVAQQAADVDGVKAASKAFYTALAALDGGAAMEKVWAHTPYVTYVGPRAKTIIVGWDAQKKYWVDTDKLFSSRNVSLSEQHIHVNGNSRGRWVKRAGQQK
jgi:hypothetical protein